MMTKMEIILNYLKFLNQLGEGDGIHLSNQPGIVYLQTTVTNEAGEVTQQMIPVHTSALQVSVNSCVVLLCGSVWARVRVLVQAK